MLTFAYIQETDINTFMQSISSFVNDPNKQIIDTASYFDSANNKHTFLVCYRILNQS